MNVKRLKGVGDLITLSPFALLYFNFWAKVHKNFNLCVI
nr:MAG TPA: hypothetical protein [Microviridae sp.]